MDYIKDTIAAIATPPGRGGVGIVRISGPDVATIAGQLFGQLPKPRQAVLQHFRDDSDQAIDHGLVLYFPGPASFTGEDVLELQGHGGPVVMDLLLARVCALGARIARPGEFSERAFFNDKLDLAQAEAIADLIDSGTAEAARAAMRSLEGRFSVQVETLVEQLIQLRMYVEAAIDFPEEEVDFLADRELGQRLAGIERQFDSLQQGASQGRLLREGMTVVIAGLPNAGKSSLLNALAGQEAAIVTALPGTTRDVLREHIQLDGMPLHVIDTAGLRETEDTIEQEGVRRAWQQIEQADRLLLVIDDQQGMSDADDAILAALPTSLPVTRVLNKIDCTGRKPGQVDAQTLALSATRGAGLEHLKQHLLQVMGYDDQIQDGFIARRRHIQALQRARRHIEQGRQQLEEFRAGELLAEELLQAQQALEEITGRFTSEDLLGRIFSSFCIGK